MAGRISVIPPESLEPGVVYELRSRNLLIGAYNGNGGFVGIREKFGRRYLDTEILGATAFPVAVVGQVPIGVSLEERLGVIDPESGRAVLWLSVPTEGRWAWCYADTNEPTGRPPDSVPNDALYEVLRALGGEPA